MKTPDDNEALMLLSQIPEDALVLLLKHEFWRQGNLSYLLDETQLEIYNFVKNNKSNQTVVTASRQLGKSFDMLVMAIECCILNPFGVVNYISKTFGAVKKFTQESMRIICQDAPNDLKPEFNAQDSKWVFPNGASIQLIGADDERSVARIRGPRVIRHFIDEFAFLDSLDAIMETIKPMGIRNENGTKTTLGSSPATSPGHASYAIEDAADAQGARIVRDYWSPGLVSLEQKKAFVEQEAIALNMTVEEYMDTSTFKREFLCHRVIDEKLAIAPQFRTIKSEIVKEYTIPPRSFLHIAVDPGVQDGTGIVFARYHFEQAKTVVEHELFIKQGNTQVTATAIQEVLAIHYPNEPIHRFVADCTTQKSFCQDMWNYHGLSVSPAINSDREGRFNRLQLAIQQRKVIISPKCPILIRQLENAIRGKNGDITRNKTDLHFDVLSAFSYLLDCIDKTTNPYPVQDFGPKPGFNYQPTRKEPTLQNAFKSMMERKKKLF